MILTTLQQQILGIVTAAGLDSISLDDLAGEVCYRSERSPSAARAACRDVLRRLGAEGLVESLDGGEHWRRTT